MSKMGYLFKRSLAFIIDMSILGIIQFLVDNYVSIFPTQLSFQIFCFLMIFAYFFYFEGVTGDSTPGKRPFELHTINLSTGKGAYFFRALLMALSMSSILNYLFAVPIYGQVAICLYTAAGLYSFLALFVGPRPQMIHDLLTKTHVVKIGESWEDSLSNKKKIVFALLSLLVSAALGYWTYREIQTAGGFSEEARVDLEKAISQNIYSSYKVRNTTNVLVFKDISASSTSLSIALIVPYSQIDKMYASDLMEPLLALTPEQREFLISKNSLALFGGTDSGFFRKNFSKNLMKEAWAAVIKSESEEIAKRNKEMLVGEWLGLDQEYERTSLRTADGKYELSFKNLADGKIMKDTGEWFVSENYYGTCTKVDKRDVCYAYRIKSLSPDSMTYEALQNGQVFTVNRVKK